METIRIYFGLRNLVKILPLKCEGRITAILIVEGGIKYEVRYFNGAEVKFVFFFEDELERI